MLKRLLVLFFCATFPLTTRAGEELLPADRPIPAVIDSYVEQRLEAENVAPAPLIEDGPFLRRLTLDLAGRVPTLQEFQSYTNSADPNKKQQAIARLLDAPDFAYHQRNRIDELLLAELRKDNSWREYLLKSVQANKPWDQLFREMMLADESNEETAPASQFLKARVRDVNAMTNDTSRLFFGVSVNCAQCHDHPLVADWKQDHYFGFVSFFDRTFETKSKKLAEKFSGEVKFKDTFGDEKVAKYMFLTGASIEEPLRELTDEQKKQENELVNASMKEEKAPQPEPQFRPRAQFVELALAEENRKFFAQSIVNRMWASLFGRGIIDPPDQNHSANPPSHPQLLAWLERDLVAHNYDLKRLIGGIVASDAYARSSVWASGELPAESLFAIAPVRPLTPRQYSLSLLISTHNPENLPASVADPKWGDLRKNWENAAEGFADQLERPGENFQVSVDEALLFSNNSRIENDYLRDSGDKLVGRMKQLDNPQAQIELAFQTIVSRTPSPEELSGMINYLEERADRPVEALKQLVWALLTSPEARFNH